VTGGRFRVPLPLLPPLLFALSSFFALLLLCQVVAYDAAGGRAKHRVVVRKMPRHASHGGTLETTLRLGGTRSGEQNQSGERRRNPLFR
jgi:hypothetical protein